MSSSSSWKEGLERLLCLLEAPPNPILRAFGAGPLHAFAHYCSTSLDNAGDVATGRSSVLELFTW